MNKLNLLDFHPLGNWFSSEKYVNCHFTFFFCIEGGEMFSIASGLTNGCLGFKTSTTLSVVQRRSFAAKPPPEFHYQPMFESKIHKKTTYRKLTSDYVSTIEIGGEKKEKKKYTMKKNLTK